MMDRYRPPWIDRVRDGVHGGEKAVWLALLSVAASAIQAGLTYPDWVALLGETRSNLGRQARLRDGGREHTDRSYHRLLQRAWDRETRWLAAAPPPFTKADIIKVIAAVEQVATDPGSTLANDDRAVLAHACQVARRNGTTRPALPRRGVQEATGLTPRKAEAAVARLGATGLLTLAVRGTPGIDGTRRRANLYRLAEEAAVHAYLTPQAGSMAHPGQVYGTPAAEPLGTSGQVYGTSGEDNMRTDTVTLTVTGNPEALARAIRLLAAQDVGVVTAPVEPTQAMGRRLHAVASGESR